MIVLNRHQNRYLERFRKYPDLNDRYFKGFKKTILDIDGEKVIIKARDGIFSFHTVFYGYCEKKKRFIGDLYPCDFTDEPRYFVLLQRDTGKEYRISLDRKGNTIIKSNKEHYNHV